MGGPPNAGRSGRTETGEWRALRRVATGSIPVAPKWLKDAKAFKDKQPSAWRHVRLAENILREFRIRVHVGGMKIMKEGLVVRLGSITRKKAYDVLIAIAETGAQEDTVTINLEDALSVWSKRQELDIQQLGEICKIRGTCSDLTKAGKGGATIVDREGGEPLAEMSVSKLVEVMEAVDKELSGRLLSSVLFEWAEVGWEICHENEAGTYPLEQVIFDVI